MQGLEAKLKKFAMALINQEKARVIIPGSRPEKGFWFGSGNLIEDKNGVFYTCGRYRNSGDSRTGLDLGDRGAELAIFESKDRCKSFQKIHSIMKTDLPGKVLSIEGTAMNIAEDGIFELFISSEKSDAGYPASVKDFLKPGTGVWSIDIITAESVKGLTADKVRPLVSCNAPEFVHVKDPFLYRSYNRSQYLLFCTHPYMWSSSNTAYMKRSSKAPEYEAPVWEFFRRGYTWDVAMTRGTCVFDMPQVGVLKNKRLSLFFYDGGECVRNLDEHEKAVKRPRGYSCEELGGLAYIEGGCLHSVKRLSVDLPMFLSPYGTACSRYVQVTQSKEGIFAIWQQSQKDCSQPLVMNFLSNKEIEELLS